MGYMRHNAIIVSGSYDDWIERAHIKATDLGMHVTPIVESDLNDIQTFLVIPDGSKEGWAESDDGDKRRSEFRRWLDKQRYEDGSSPLAWVEVQYGDDEGETKVVAHSDKLFRRQAARTDGP